MDQNYTAYFSDYNKTKLEINNQNLGNPEYLELKQHNNL